MLRSLLLTTIGVGLVLTAVNSGSGKDVRALQVRWAQTWRAEKLPIEIPVGDEPQSVNLQLPPMQRKEGNVLCLRFAVRLHTETPAGWNNYLALSINGETVTPLNQKRLPRLLNHSSFFRSSLSSEPQVPYFSDRFGIPALVVFFMPDFTSVDERVQSEREEGGWYLLDVDDLLHTDAPNVLTLTNLAVKRYWRGAPPAGLRMVIDGLEIGAVPIEEVKRLRGIHLVRRKPLKGVAISGDGVILTSVSGGGVQIETDGEIYFVESAFSFTSEKGVGFNQWRCLEEVLGEPSWKPKARRVSDRTLEVTSEGNNYRLVRRVTLRGHRIEVEDVITNKTDEVIGVLIRHELLTPEFPMAHRLSGLDEVAIPERRFPENPTVFVAQKKTALGAVVEDSALRLQMGSGITGNVVKMEFNHFGLPPKSQRAMKWALYPIKRKSLQSDSDDYFAFINSVRRDWKVNFTVLGPFEFVDARQLQGEDAEKRVRELVERKGVRIFALAPWFEYYSSADMTRDEYKALTQKAMQVIKGVRPDAVCIALLESNLTPVPLSFFGDTLPPDLPYGRPGNTYPIGKTPGVYGWRAPKGATAKIDASQWRDSVMRDADGNILLDTWYVHAYAGKALNLMVYPTLDNYWHKQMLDKIRFVLDDVGFDGIYFDQFSYAYGLADRFTYDRWDNCTVDIDEKTGLVIRRYADLGLLTSSARIEWVKEVLKRGKIVVANSMPAVMEEQSLPIFRFMETQGYDPLSGDAPNQKVCAKGKLASPIGLGHQWGALKEKSARCFIRTVIAHLRYGLLYYYYGTWFPSEGETGGEFGPVKHMFPITPVELGEGFVIGKERIITCVSRTFEWQGQRKPSVRLFDEYGREMETTPQQVAIAKIKNAWRITIRLRDWWQIAVVE